MPKLKIDGVEIEVPKGMKAIEAASRLGIIIPRFCYHAGLGSVGACRMCAVKFVEGPVKGVQMSCMVDAQDGMVVSTLDAEAVDFRKQVIEWLMMNHPHDCPVCDEGGHCLLQDMTVSGGHGIRRYLGKKRTYSDQFLGTFVQHEMNRCIHCWRCRRFYQEFAGYRDLGAMQIGYRTYFGRAKEGPLESPFAGNLIDLCPTGVYTDKPSRFKGRRWDYQRSPSLCIHCSLGCHTIVSARYREIVRLEARFSEAVNGYFICDRGRYGFSYTNHPERPRHPTIGGEHVSWEKAIKTAVEKLREIRQKRGPESIACLGSTRSSLETQAMLKHFCRLLGSGEPAYFPDPAIARKAKGAVARLDERLAVSMREIEKADFILAVAADPLNEAPMLALAMRQAWRRGAAIAVMDPRPVSLPFEFDHLPVKPKEVNVFLNDLIRRSVSRGVIEGLGTEALRVYDGVAREPSDPAIEDRFRALAGKLEKSRFPVIVCGTDLAEETTPAVAADHALFLLAAKERAGLFYLMPGANAFGAAFFSTPDAPFTGVLDSIEKGLVKALILVESDPFDFLCEAKRIGEAIRKLDLLLVMDYLPSTSVGHSHIMIPTSTLFETESIFVNQEGRAQLSTSVHQGGTPIEQLTSGNHPPRQFRKDIPGGEPKAAWKVLDELAQALFLEDKPVSREDLFGRIVQGNPCFFNLSSLEARPDGLRITSDLGQKPFSVDWTPKQEPGDDTENLELLLTDLTFGTEELSRYSRPIQEVEKNPFVFLHARDAERLGLKSGDRIVLHLDGVPLEVEASAAENMAPGVIVLPKHRQLPWDKLGVLPLKVPLDWIEKVPR